MEVSTRSCGTAGALGIALASLACGRIGYDRVQPEDASAADAVVTPDGAIAPVWPALLSGTGPDRGYQVALDREGNVVVAGFFSGTMTMGGRTLVSATDSSGASTRDLVLYEISPQGELLWLHHFRSPGQDYQVGFVIDADDDVVMFGEFACRVDFDDASFVAADAAEPATCDADIEDVYVAVFEGAGIYAWGHTITADATLIPDGASLSADGKVVLVVKHKGTVRFANGDTYTSRSATYDVAMVKLSRTGIDWTVGFGSDAMDSLEHVALDPDGNLVVAGYFASTLDFDDGTRLDTANIEDGDATNDLGADILVAKYGADGTRLWASPLGGSGDDTAFALGVGSNGDIVIGGGFTRTVTIAGESHTSQGGIDALAIGLAPDGTVSWSRAFGTLGDDVIHGLSVLPNLSIAVTGRYEGALDYGGTPLPAHGGSDILFAGLTARGEPGWAHGYGGAGDDTGWGISAAPNAGLVLTGEADGAVAFGEGTTAQGGSGSNGFVSIFCGTWCGEPTGICVSPNASSACD